MSKASKTATVLGSIAFLVALGIGPMSDVNAQTPAPCEDCGPSGLTGDGTRAFGYANFFCVPKSFTATMGVGPKVKLPQTISWRVTQTGTLAILGTGSHTFTAGQPLAYTTNLVAATAGHVEVAFTSTVPFYNPDSKSNLKFRTQLVSCECDNPPTTVATTVPATSTPSTPPSSTGSSVPGTPSTPATTVPGTPTTVAFELPATGSSGWVPLGAALLAFAGACLLLLGRKPEVEQ